MAEMISKKSAAARRRERCHCGQFAHGDRPCGVPRRYKLTPTERLRRLEKYVVAAGPDECWYWSGNSFTTGGYPTYGGTQVSRLLLGLKRGDGIVARHTCDNPPCVNRRHLIAGTDADNKADMVNRDRSNHGTRHWNVRLTPEQVRAIRADPRASTVVAAEYGMSARYIRRLRAGDRWQRLLDE